MQLAMKHPLVSRRLLDALTPQPRGASHAVEPFLQLDELPPPQQAAPAPAPAVGGVDVERLLEEGSDRVYVPMREADVLD